MKVDSENPKLRYSAPEIVEVGDAEELTLGQTGPSVDADAQPAPYNGNPALEF